MTTEVAKRLINAEEYYKMAEVGILKHDDRLELIHGEIYEMSPIGSKHSATVKRLSRIISEALKGEITIGVQDPVRMNQFSETEPDISILKFRKDDYAKAHPTPVDVLAIIEVADSSIYFDRGTKLHLYAESMIPLYWIVDINERQIEVYENPHGLDYQSMKVCRSGDEIGLLSASFSVDELLLAED